MFLFNIDWINQMWKSWKIDLTAKNRDFHGFRMWISNSILDVWQKYQKVKCSIHLPLHRYINSFLLLFSFHLDIWNARLANQLESTEITAKSLHTCLYQFSLLQNGNKSLYFPMLKKRELHRKNNMTVWESFGGAITSIT